MFSSIVNLIFFVVLGSCLTTTGTALPNEILPGQYPEESSGPINVVRSLMDQVSALNKQVMELNNQFSTLNAKGLDLPDVLRQLFNQDAALHNQVSALNTKVTYETIAFTATIQSQIDLSEGYTVVFPDVVMNQGQCYDKYTGIFTTPRAGLYNFHLSMTSRCNGCAVQVSLRVNDKTLSKLFADDKASIDQSSKTFIAELEKGDTVKVVAYGTTRLFQDGWNVFSGYLVKPR